MHNEAFEKRESKKNATLLFESSFLVLHVVCIIVFNAEGVRVTNTPKHPSAKTDPKTDPSLHFC